MNGSSRFAHTAMLDRDDVRHVSSSWSAKGPGGVVATAHYLATAAGVDVLERGGNAVDAAVAGAFALGVCEFQSSGLGGMATLLLHRADRARTVAIPGSCRAPARATPEALRGLPRYRGYGAVATPTSVAVLAHLLANHGTWSARDVIEPALTLAEEGFPLSRFQHRVLRKHEKRLGKRNASGLFLRADGSAPPPGTLIRQPALARTLRRLATAGLEDFYLGEIARDIDNDMTAQGGFVGLDDLAAALRIAEVEPLRGRFRDSDVLTLGPPGGGLALLQMLSMASLLDPSELDLEDADGAARVAAIIEKARTDRVKARLSIGAECRAELERLLDPEYARQAVEDSIRPTTIPAAAAVMDAAPPGSGETTHLSIIDRAGNVVSMTQSIERSLGAAVATPSLGFLYNGYLRGFKIVNTRHPFFLRPGAPARSNAAPTIVVDHGRPRVAIGSTGSERMTSGIFETLLRMEHVEPFEAVHAPRLHCTPERIILWEEERFPAGHRDRLVQLGFTTEALAPYAFRMGGLQLALRGDGQCEAVADPRRDGAAASEETPSAEPTTL